LKFSGLGKLNYGKLGFLDEWNQQVVLSLHLKGFETGIILKDLKSLSERVEDASGIPVSKLGPVVGKHVFAHKSPGHLESPDLIEAFDPHLVGSKRELTNK
jgi:isopropylmalate/homocitrate/citramalate synthase